MRREADGATKLLLRHINARTYRNFRLPETHFVGLVRYLRTIPVIKVLPPQSEEKKRKRTADWTRDTNRDGLNER